MTATPPTADIPDLPGGSWHLGAGADGREREAVVPAEPGGGKRDGGSLRRTHHQLCLDGLADRAVPGERRLRDRQGGGRGHHPGLARSSGPHGILVNTISPGQIDTPMQHLDNPPELSERTAAQCPLGRMGRPEEVGAVAVFLASRHASFVNGATINVSGGLVMY